MCGTLIVEPQKPQNQIFRCAEEEKVIHHHKWHITIFMSSPAPGVQKEFGFLQRISKNAIEKEKIKYKNSWYSIRKQDYVDTEKKEIY